MSIYHVLKNASITDLNSAADVVVIGSGAGGTIGTSNFSIGKNALASVNGGTKNFAIGQDALY